MVERGDAELLGRLLRGDVRLAARLLDRFGGLRPLLDADRTSLLGEPGVGQATAAALACMPELARRYYT